MGVAYKDHARKIHLRGKVLEFMLRHVSIEKTFGEYPKSVMWAIAKQCTKHMNANYLAGHPWDRETTLEVMQLAFRDKRRNALGKAMAEAKRKAQRELAVSPALHF
jgi:hypothetical protein